MLVTLPEGKKLQLLTPDQILLDSGIKFCKNARNADNCKEEHIKLSGPEACL